MSAPPLPRQARACRPSCAARPCRCRCVPCPSCRRTTAADGRFFSFPPRKPPMTVKFSKDHEWIDAADATAAVVGITVHAQDALGDVVFVDLPEVGRILGEGEVAGGVESVKAAADVYMPVSGAITAVNESLRADPSLANSHPLRPPPFFQITLTHSPPPHPRPPKPRRLLSPFLRAPPGPIPSAAHPLVPLGARKTPPKSLPRHIGIDAD